jgi:hypothetical protein
MLRFFCHAIAADAEKIQPVMQNFKVRPRFDLFSQFIQVIQVRIDDFAALDTDDVRMGKGLVSVISVAPIREPQFEDFTQ